MKNLYIIFLFMLISNFIVAQQLATQTWDKTNKETQLGKQTIKEQRSSSFTNNSKPLGTSNWIVNGTQICRKDLNESISKIEIFDVQGKKVNGIGEPNGNCFQLSNSSNGIYVIRWKVNNYWKSEKISLLEN